MPVRGIRGATHLKGDSQEAILEGTRELLEAVVEANRLDPADIASVIFTATPDLTADFPAHAARLMGWTDVPLLCATEINVPGRLQRCIRVLLHVNTDRAADQIKHIYLHEAKALRTDR